VCLVACTLDGLLARLQQAQIERFGWLPGNGRFGRSPQAWLRLVLYPAPLTSGCLAHWLPSPPLPDSDLASALTASGDGPGGPVRHPSPHLRSPSRDGSELPPFVRPSSLGLWQPSSDPRLHGNKDDGGTRKGVAVCAGPAPEQRSSSNPRLLRATPLPAPPRRAASDCECLCGRRCCGGGG